MYKWLLVVMLSAAFFFHQADRALFGLLTYEQISMEEAKRLMTEEVGYIIVDVRTLEEYAGGHIPNAICIPNESIGDEMPEKLPNKEQLILVYCRSGNRSKQASQKLTKLDYTNVKEFGGIMDWDGDIEQ